ncbi:hypothetical protein RJ640_011035, partial [Escallonia rubra]
MIDEYKLENNSWILKLYESRLKWCVVFSKDTFSADIRSTQRSESTNNVFQDMACKTMTLTEFFYHYEKNAVKMREKEVEDDFDSARGKPKVVVKRYGLLNHASSVYTHTIFRMVQHEFIQSLSEHVVDTSQEGTISRYMLKCEGGKREHKSKGWLCRHALRVLNVCIKAKRIPEQYVLKRWTKGAKR